ncbi:hypothetical protein N431DRAFT_482792 [Stipitochalara longipes BDJ]|nr:hypothetical protein N431DRAFT_482792 [Stipitochalara longipes BDJ]
MAQQTDIEACVQPPILPAPVFGGNVREQVTQLPNLKPTIHAANNSKPSFLGSSAREQMPAATQPRRRKQTGRLPAQAPEGLREAGKFFDALQAELEDGVRQHCLFLCWEASVNDQRAVPLLIENKEDELDEVKIYRDMAAKLYETQPWWLKYNPFCQVLGVEEVEFRFLKKQENDFSVVIEKLDLLQIKTELVSRLEDAKNYSCKITDLDEYPESCYEDANTGGWTHDNQHCINAREVIPFLECPFKEEKEFSRKLDRLRLLSLPLLCFKDPGKAANQRTLEGMAQDSCVYRTSGIRGYRGFKPRVAEAKFRGLMFCFGFQRVWTPFDAPTMALMIVTLWKVRGGSWEVAFAAGAFFLMLVPFLTRLYQYL